MGFTPVYVYLLKKEVVLELDNGNRRKVKILAVDEHGVICHRTVEDNEVSGEYIPWTSIRRVDFQLPRSLFFEQ